MILHAFGSTDAGRVRPRNEDAFVVRPDIGLLAVADGMGGHAAGDVASRTALAAMADPITMGPLTESSVRAAVEAANHAVWRAGNEDPDKAGMGTTLTVVFFTLDRTSFIVGHVGDSRLYRLRDGSLEQLTRDHTVVQEMVDAGQLTRHAARRHPLGSILRRSVGTRPDIDVDVARYEMKPGDFLLICSDGLTGMLDDEELLVLMKQTKPMPEICREIIDAANLRGGIDNITAVLIRAEAV